MGGLVLWLVLAAFVAAIAISIRRSTQLFVLKVRQGRVRFLRGRIPSGLLGDVEDIVRQPPVAEAKIYCLRSGDEAYLRVEGQLGEAQRQQLRNVVGNYSLPKILDGRRPPRG